MKKLAPKKAISEPIKKSSISSISKTSDAKKVEKPKEPTEEVKKDELKVKDKDKSVIKDVKVPPTKPTMMKAPRKELNSFSAPNSEEKMQKVDYGLPIPDELMIKVESECKTDLCEESDLYNLDVCFVLDCTGSMGSYIQMARDKIVEIVDQLKAQYTDSIVRISIVGYRDVGDKVRFEIFGFESSSDLAKEFLKSLKADGGDDEPEDVNGAFQMALYKLKWKYPTRMLYHLSDAPCHGSKFHKTTDSYPNGYKQDINWKRLMEGMKKLDVSYIYFNIGNKNVLMFEKLKELYDQSLVEEEKSNLLFNHEVLEVIRNNTIIRERVIDGAIGAEESKPSMAHDYFAAKTVEHAKKSRAVNIEKMSKKKM